MTTWSQLNVILNIALIELCHLPPSFQKWHAPRHLQRKGSLGPFLITVCLLYSNQPSTSNFIETSACKWFKVIFTCGFNPWDLNLQSLICFSRLANGTVCEWFTGQWTNFRLSLSKKRIQQPWRKDIECDGTCIVVLRDFQCNTISVNNNRVTEYKYIYINSIIRHLT